MNTIKVGELHIGRSYLVSQIRRAVTRYGSAIIIHVDVEGEEFQIFLPNRVVKIIDEELLKEMADRCQKLELFIIHNGDGRFNFE